MLMSDLQSKKWIYTKGFLFLVIGISATALLILDNPNLRFVFLLTTAIWAFCRFYYFAFYVITNYIDNDFKFASLTSFFVYLWRRKK